MTTKILYSNTFERKYKRYSKKFFSLESDLKLFLKSINETISIDLGGGIYKYRLAVKSKNKGKSGGFRIITFELIVSVDIKEITLLTIFDKNDQASISKSQINDLLKSLD